MACFEILTCVLSGTKVFCSSTNYSKAKMLPTKSTLILWKPLTRPKQSSGSWKSAAYPLCWTTLVEYWRNYCIETNFEFFPRLPKERVWPLLCSLRPLLSCPVHHSGPYYFSPCCCLWGWARRLAFWRECCVQYLILTYSNGFPNRMLRVSIEWLLLF